MRVLVSQLSTVGREVRSTTMQWAYEGKKLDAGMKFLAWRPPWVEAAPDAEDEDPAVACLGENTRIPDLVGLGRIPSFWYTLNSMYSTFIF